METDPQKQQPPETRKTSVLLDVDLLNDLEAFASKHNMSVEEVFQCANRTFLKTNKGLINPCLDDDHSETQH